MLQMSAVMGKDGHECISSLFLFAKLFKAMKVCTFFCFLSSATSSELEWSPPQSITSIMVNQLQLHLQQPQSYAPNYVFPYFCIHTGRGERHVLDKTMVQIVEVTGCRTVVLMGKCTPKVCPVPAIYRLLIKPTPIFSIQSIQMFISETVKKEIDAWIAIMGLNAYGHEVNGSVTTLQWKNSYEYIIVHFPQEPWKSIVSSSEQTAINAWLSASNLNTVGDDIHRIYSGGNPLFNSTDGSLKDRYVYLLAKFPNRPWKKPSVVAIYQSALTTGDASVDRWLKAHDLNRYGDARNMNYIGGTPLFDSSTGMSVDRMMYLKAKFPDAPWQQK